MRVSTDVSGTVRRDLHRLARAYGIQPAYRDLTGGLQTATVESLLGGLRALGCPIQNPDSAATHLRRRRVDHRSEPLPPIAVAWHGGRRDLHVSVPEDVPAARIEIDLRLETGEHRALEPPIRSRRRSVDGTIVVTWALPLPADLPVGYHDLYARIDGRRARSMLIVAPRVAFAGRTTDQRRSWGVFAPLYAFHDDRLFGGGDYTCVSRVADWLSELGADTFATLPILPTFLRTPVDPSPYSAISRHFWNEAFIDLTDIPELESNAAARRMLDGRRFEAQAARARAGDYVDHAEVMRLKRKVLARLATTFFSREGSRRAAFQSFLERHPDLERYAAFRAIVDLVGAGPHAWEPRVAQGDITESDYDPHDFHTHLYAQWIASEQAANAVAHARAKGVGFCLDVPVGSHPDGFDCWNERESYVSDVRVGAPPDPLAPGGQDWGFPPLHPDVIGRDRFHHVIRIVRHHMAHARVLRIDHVMGLHRLFWIPPGLDAKQGVYVRYPQEALYAILCLESHRNETLVLGEDLGTVPGSVRSAMADHGLHRMHVVQSELSNGLRRALVDIPDRSAVYVNTHDMPPFAAFWDGTDIDAWESLGILSPTEADAERRVRTRAHESFPPGTDADHALRMCLDGVARSPARLALVNLEDLWLETRSQNVPGTSSERNWSRKMTRSLSDITSDASLRARLTELDRTRRGLSESSPSPPVPPQVETSAITDDEIYLFNEGRYLRAYDKLGAHRLEFDGVDGVHFAVWAPNAAAVSVIGSFNGWQADAHTLSPVQSSGIWATFVPGAKAGDVYKFRITSPDGSATDKADPYAFQAEAPPRTASIVADLDYTWRDEEWLAQRAERQRPEAPLSVYEMHLGSWLRDRDDDNRWLTYTEMAPKLIRHITDMGFTHVEILPISEHPFYGSWGYQVTGYFAPTARYGSPTEFMAFVDALHRAGIGVILDWVPSHFPGDEHGLATFDGTHLYEHSDPRQGFHPDWQSYIFNFGRHEVRGFLISSALFWLDRYHIDGIRVDAVASMLYLDYSREEGEWIPNKYGGKENLEAIAFIRALNDEIGRVFPGVLRIAEESTAWPMVSRPTHIGGLGFDYKWDMGWMHDTLSYMALDPFFRSHHHNELTFRQMYAHSESFILALSHDEVVHGKQSLLSRMPGDWWQRFANLRLLFGYMFGLPGKKLLFMGSELATWVEWNHESDLAWSLEEEPMHRGVRDWLVALNALYRSTPALHQRDVLGHGFEWIDCDDHAQSTLSFLRLGEDAPPVLVLLNFTPVPRDGFRVGVPVEGEWRQVLSGDDARFGGSGAHGADTVTTEPIQHHNRPHSITVTLPPLAATFWVGPRATDGTHG